ncbi:hypothetical protein LCGC14_1474590 [marine sediment metagenome]|uniref:Uncharacterized protein n=1 Tax=marine sediment metagenome TaxID=412755 RepID=A0A0F9JBB4_9ZZZZ
MGTILLIFQIGSVLSSEQESTPTISKTAYHSRALDVKLDKCLHRTKVIYFEGTIENHGEYAYGYVRVRLAVEIDGKEVGTDSWFINSDILRPGASSTWNGHVRVSLDFLDFFGAGCSFKLESFQVIPN